MQHPDISHAINQIFDNDLNFCQQVQESIELCDKCKHLSTISGKFYKLIDRNRLSKTLLQQRFAIRLLKSNKDRQLIRKQKCMQVIDLKSICNKGSEIWNRQPLHFEKFTRFNIPYIKDIKEYEEMSKRYEELGCETITNKLTNEIKQLRIAFSERYYGFNRITIAKASLILAKMHGYRFKTAWDIHGNKSNSIVSTYEKYLPQAYPLHELIHIASDDILKLIEHLDNFPGINGKTLFDDYIVLAPSGIREKVQPILLGTRDNKCYFICFYGDNNECQSFRLLF